MDAYLDIETSYAREITVLGIYFSNGRFRQFVGNEISRDSITKALKKVKKIFTYNGNSFDIPEIRKRLDVDLFEGFECHDLMRECHKKNLYGGLKGVERILGIKRRTRGMDGYQAMKLWQEYEDLGNKEALKILLLYNKEDTVNLHKLRKIISKKDGKKNS
ncbi:MAG: ribonuclease H-like domain-containing protein [Candidatus Omnitrophota bacterium]